MNTSNPPSIPTQPLYRRSDFLVGLAAGVGLSVLCAFGLLLIAAAVKKPLPVTVSFRAAALQQGLVAEIRNSSSEPLKIGFTLHSAGSGTAKQGELFLPPNGMTEIGWMEGWRFVPGETVTLKNSNYRTLTFVVPKT